MKYTSLLLGMAALICVVDIAVAMPTVTNIAGSVARNQNRRSLTAENASTDLDAAAYLKRGIEKDQRLNDSGALADYNQAIALNPNYAEAYFKRGILKAEKLNDPQGALADHNRSIAIAPRSALVYCVRAVLKYEKLNDSRGALDDYSQAIAIDPNYASAYIGRGIAKYTQLNDRAGGVADVRKGADLAKAQDDTHLLTAALDVLQSWNAS